MLEHTDIIAGLAGTGLAGILAKWAITRALKDLENVCNKVTEIYQQLAVISVKLEKLIDHEKLLKEHSKKIAHLEVNHELRKRVL